jgi:cyclic pyranopterin phosphate synthase
VRERFHILAGVTCNNNCLFCMEHEGEERSFRHLHVTPERVRELLRANAAAGEVMFTSGEPTLNPHLPRYLRWARELGYRRVGLTTNGRRLGYARYTRGLLAAGLNHVVVSIHGPDARCHEGQTRTPGSFAQTLAGLEALAGLKRDFKLTVHTSTVVGKRNYRRLRELYHLLRAFSVDQYVFNVMQPLGRAAHRVESLVARYADIVHEFARLLRVAGEPRPPMFLVDLPLCTTEELPAPVRGYVEFAFFTEFDGDGAPRERATRVHKEAKNRVKRAECRRCAHDAGCLGVWSAYVDAFGWDEFVPARGRPRHLGERRPGT